MRTFARHATPLLASVSIAVLAALYGLAGLRYHGVTSDSPSLFYAGDRTLYLAHASGCASRARLPGPRAAGLSQRLSPRSRVRGSAALSRVPGLAAAVTSQIFHDRLEWLDVIDGHHPADPVACIRTVHQMPAADQTRGTAGGGRRHHRAGAVSLRRWPCLQQCEGLALCAVLRLRDPGHRNRYSGRARTMAADCGRIHPAALACKLNGVFIFATILLWTPVAYGLRYYRRRDVPADVVAGYLVAPYVAGAIFFVLWPWLYQGMLPEWWAHVSEHVRFMVTIGRGSRQTWTDFPLRPVLFMTPPLVSPAPARMWSPDGDTIASAARSGRSSACGWQSPSSASRHRDKISWTRTVTSSSTCRRCASWRGAGSTCSAAIRLMPHRDCSRCSRAARGRGR